MKIIYFIGILFALLLMNNTIAKGQGNVTLVTPDSSEVGANVTLQISGTGTAFSIGTTTLRRPSTNSVLAASSVTVVNSNTISATYQIPNNLFFIGLWDVWADNAAPLTNGFTITNAVWIKGDVFVDTLANCLHDAGEPTIPLGHVIAQPGNVYAYVDANGHYELNMPLGNYTASITYFPTNVFPTYLNISCPINNTISLPISASVPTVINNQNFAFALENMVVRGKIFKDVNANCINDVNEQVSYIGYVKAQPGNVIAPVGYDGKYELVMPTGNYITNITYFPQYINTSFMEYNCPLGNLASAQVTSAPAYVDATAIGYEVLDTIIVEGNIYFDANTNCAFNGNEQTIPYGYISSQNGSYAYINSNGYYKLYLPVGNYTTNITYHTSWWNYWSNIQYTCPALGTMPVIVASAVPTTLSNYDFGIVPDTCADLSVSLWNWSMRPCFQNFNYISYYNNSNDIDTNITLTLTFDSLHIINYASIPWTSNSGNEVTFTLSVGPYQYGYFVVQDSILCNAVVGNSSCIQAVVTPSVSSCVDTINNSWSICRIFSLSWDPNEKYVYQPTNIAATDSLIYTIAFQNTGTDTAFTVSLIDTLSGFLEPYSLVPIASSHPFSYSLIHGNVARFLFNNIQLPDSNVNEAASHGFVTFAIKQKPNNTEGTIINNTANIYFDYNDAVITGTTVNMIPLIIGEKENQFNPITVYPNPFTNTTRFIFKDKNSSTKYTLAVYDVTGQLVRNITNITGNYFDFESGTLPSQMYFYKVMNEEKQIGVGKLIINK